MENPQLDQYIKSQLDNGITKDQLFTLLLAKGWQPQSIQNSFDFLSGGQVQNSFLANQTPQALETQVQPISQPQIQVQSQTPTMVETNNKPKKSKKKIIIICTALFLTFSLILGGGIFAYITFFPSPEIVLVRAFQNTSQIKSMEFSGDLNIKGKMASPGLSTSEGDVDFGIKGEFDNNDSNNKKLATGFSLNANIKDQQPIKAKIVTQIVDKNFYAIINEGPDFVDTIKNIWLKVPISENPEAQKVQDALENNSKAKKITPEQQKRLNDQTLKIAKISKVYANDKVDKIETYHYQYQITPLELAKFTALSSEIFLEQPAMTDVQKEDQSKELKDKPPIEGEIWIGKNDYRIYRINTSYTYNKDPDNYITVAVDLKAKNYNQPIQIEAPATSKTFQEISEILFPPQTNTYTNSNSTSTSTYQPKGQDSSNKIIVNGSIDDDKDGLTNSEESYYGTDPKNPDTDKDGYNDGAEVKAGYDPNGPGKLDSAITANTCLKNNCNVTQPSKSYK